MPQTTPEEQPGQRFVLGANPSVRSLIAAAFAAVAGALLLVAWGANDWSVVVAVLAMLLLVSGIALALGAMVAFRRFAQTLLLGPDSITVVGRRTYTLRWADITEVKLSGNSMVLQTREGGGAQEVTINPGGYSEDVFVELAQAIRAGLDADRGYRSLS